jgi:DNA-directed RNA polymerase subunit RPC12/RpoP
MAMFRCNRCGSDSNVITLPTEHVRCPVCKEGVLVPTEPVVFDCAKSFRQFAQVVGWRERVMAEGIRQGYDGTYFLWHCQDYWDDYFGKKGGRN